MPPGRNSDRFHFTLISGSTLTSTSAGGSCTSSSPSEDEPSLDADPSDDSLDASLTGDVLKSVWGQKLFVTLMINAYAWGTVGFDFSVSLSLSSETSRSVTLLKQTILVSPVFVSNCALLVILRWRISWSLLLYGWWWW